jgi:hypothetical protein
LKPQMRTHISICISLFSCIHCLVDSFILTRLFIIYHCWQALQSIHSLQLNKLVQ